MTMLHPSLIGCGALACMLAVGVVPPGAASPGVPGTDEPAVDRVPGEKTIRILDAVHLEWDAEKPEVREVRGYTLRRHGQEVEVTVDLPEMPENQRDARRITVIVEAEPRLVATEGGYRPGDPWTRLGSVMVVVPEEHAAEPLHESQPLPETGTAEDAEPELEDAPPRVELMRFVTGFGGAGTFSSNVTSLAPLLSGKTTFRVHISTYMSPGWDVTLSLRYEDEGAGFRRPVFARALFLGESVTAEHPVRRARVTIPEGLDRPRIRILSTGHATDGAGGDEFITRTHVLRINGEEVARWRPWAEDGGRFRPANPMSGRMMVDGRELFSSDLDRSGWHPGRIVWPKRIPVPELSPGEHEVEVEIIGIRPTDPDDEDGDYGYWRLSAVVVADEPWPEK